MNNFDPPTNPPTRRFRRRHVCAALLLFLPVDAIQAEVIFQNDFEDDPVGTYTVTNMEADWNSPGWDNGVAEGRVAITDDAHAFDSKSLVVTYPEGKTSAGKTQWKLALGTGYEELFLSYRIRFDDGFDFVRGGKLPGFIGGEGNVGGDKPTGTDGWSARMMWRTNGSSGSPTTGDSANIVQYVYHPDQPSENEGEDFRWDDTPSAAWQVFEAGTWYHLQHRVVMNTIGQHDGIIQAWLDGVMVLDLQNLRFRDAPTDPDKTPLQINQMYFSTFFGGKGSQWEPTKDERIYFDDFVISTEFINTPNTPNADFNNSGAVDGDDLTLWLAGFASNNAQPSDGDADNDHDVDGHDFLAWQRAVQPTSAASGSSVQIPEPQAMLLSLIALVVGFASMR